MEQYSFYSSLLGWNYKRSGIRILVLIKIILHISFTFQNAHRLTFNNATVDANPKFLSAEIHIKTKGDRNYADINATVFEELMEPLLMDGRMTRLRKDNLYNDTVITFENVNYCKLHILSERNPVVNVIFVHIGHFGNLMAGCPVKKVQ